MDNTSAPVHATCRDCQQPFVISLDEQRFFQQLAAAKAPERSHTWCYPSRCSACRAERRQKRLATVDNGQAETCSDCGMSFVFGTRDKAYYAQQQFAPPKRCRACRRQRAASHGA